MKSSFHVLGVDIGSVSISVAEVSSQREVVKTAYDFHHGTITENLKRILAQFDFQQIGWIAATSSTPSLLKVTRHYDNCLSVISACRHFHSEFGSILIVGGEKFGLVRFDKEGNYLNFKANTSCAAGTGSFLDQQAQRLNLNGIEELSEIAFRNAGVIPKIASRCAVFAKTDLVHAQQEGYSLEEICDGLCHGLAKNIVDTLFSGDRPNSPLIFSGGVARNKSVVQHIQAMIGVEVIVEKSLYGAVGAALNLMDDLHDHERFNITSVDDIIRPQTSGKKYFFDRLELKLTDYPDFDSGEKYEYPAQDQTASASVEVDVYEDLARDRPIRAYLGIDIGSTSTKAVLTSENREVLAGFYTRTAGRPVMAVQSLFAAKDDLIGRKGIDLQIIAAGTTGSGRKLSGKIIGADMIVDEITAHARAAAELNPNVDTIIEIGGQDSKFTTLKNGMVTFSVMNTVCAAGTGSFIEEQAQKLGCPLSEYSTRTELRKSPIASDRCTVFMERDINHYLSEGYAVEEALAAVLHSITENYLTKVAIEDSIGDFIFFQGATAKNKALVAAFEQRLQKPLHVSRYCHLTGALGAALLLIDQAVSETSFKGLGLHKKQIPIRSEVCEICTNHCKITVAELDDGPVAYGFLCGRDYDTEKRVSNNRSGFDLFKARRKAFSFVPRNEFREDFTIGIPAALHLYEDLSLWRMFFDELSIRTVTSEHYDNAVKDGSNIAGAEFCAPLTALHGHVKYLLGKTDYVFLPCYLEKKAREKGIRRQYCYYTQYSPALASAIESAFDGEHGGNGRVLTPLVHYLYNQFNSKIQLYQMLRKISKNGIRFLDVSAAYDKACDFKESSQVKLRDVYGARPQDRDDIHVVLLGRPYSVLSQSMNKGIPDIFASLGIKCFFQDMLSYDETDSAPIKPMLDEVHWHYAAEVLEAAQVVAQTSGAYPVFVTSFKCSPDAFAIDYFKKVLDSRGKPYLILQLDEHDSSVGYETRIESAIRSFRNHYATQQIQKPARSVSPLIRVNREMLAHKTFIMPNWDNIPLQLVAANLRKEGIDARLLEGNDASAQKGLRHNTGQCIPMNIIAQEFVDYVEAEGLNPADIVVWMPLSTIACNLGIFPHHMKNLIHSYGKGFENVSVYAGGISMSDISIKLPVNTYLAYMFGGLIKKMGCRIRPYEKVRGTTDEVIAGSVDIMMDAFGGTRSKEEAVAAVVSLFEGIDTESPESVCRPKVAIFGDLYARDNEVMNQDLIHFIEENGGEVITTPYTSFGKMIAKPYMRKWLIEGHYMGALTAKVLMAAVTRLEKRYYKYFERILKEPEPTYDASPEEILAQYHVRIENTGESMENLLKIFYLLDHYPDISFFVQTSPALCCPSLITEAMAGEIEKKTGVPVVSVTYDGTGGNKNEIIIPYLKYPRKVHV